MSTVTPIPAREVVRDSINRLIGTNGRAKPRKEPTFSIEDVTPARAAKYLATAARNRNRKASVVARYAADMRNGRWLLNGEGLKIDQDGNLIDGQHRAAAIVEAGVTVRMVVMRNVPAESFATLDQGSRRTAGDHLGLLGETNPNHLGVALGHLRRYERGDLFDTSPRGYHVSGPELVETLERFPGVRESVRIAEAAKHVISVGMLAFFHMAFARKDQALADWFVNAVADGTGLTDTDAVYHLRERLLKTRAANTRMHRVDIMKLVVQAWNKHRANEPCFKLIMPTEFPEIE